MTVSKPIFSPSTTDWPWRTGQPGAIEGRSPPSEPPMFAEREDALPMPPVSSPPLIPRVYPGL
jgi:hypothetical protein